MRIIYSDIIRGYSYCREKDCRIKHLGDEDLALVSEQEQDAKEQAVQSGLLSEREKITQLIQHGVWAPDEESRISFLEKRIKEQTAKLNTVVSKTLKKACRESIEKDEKELSRLQYKRSDILGLTVEKFMTRKRSDITIYHCFFKDRECKEHFWTEEEFDELDQDELYDFIQIYNASADEFSDKNIQRIAAQPYFLNKFFIANGDPMVFMGKPAISLTHFQSELLSSGRSYKSVLENNEKGESPPENYYDDPDKLVSWYNLHMKRPVENTNRFESKAKAGASTLTATSLVDADMDEVKASAAAKGEVVMDLNSEVEKKMKEAGKKQLDLLDILEIHGENTAGLSR
ncbi:MAG: hypothetical protein H8E05_01225 [Bacteroidetes bacterium]|nr:hypothetical protein [Bacteroidota bacterium]